LEESAIKAEQGKPDQRDAAPNPQAAAPKRNYYGNANRKTDYAQAKVPIAKNADPDAEKGRQKQWERLVREELCHI
jgi:hypothetical protein